MPSLSRRIALKLMGLGSWFVQRRVALSSLPPAPAGEDFTSHWDRLPDRVWLSEDCWANPMEDWRIVDGAAEVQTGGGDRNIHVITHQLTNLAGSFETSLRITRVQTQRLDGGAGFRLGIRSDLNEYRSNCFAKGGIRAGLRDGKLVLGDQVSKINSAEAPQRFRLVLQGKPQGDRYLLTLRAEDAAGKALGSVENQVDPKQVLGNLAIVSNFDAKIKQGQGARYRFSKWTLSGDAFSFHPERQFGPILWSMYSLSDSRGPDGFVMKISALTGPLGDADNRQIELQIERDGTWQSWGHAPLHEDAWTATFRVPNWDEQQSTPYRLVYPQKGTDGSETEHDWRGIIRANPDGRQLRMAALTCQNDYGFPYEPVANNVIKMDPDLIYFSGDQLYESHGGYGLIRDPAGPAILNYLRKFYMFGWSFREAMKDRPTVCIPDDHDVFQGNIWGEGGAKMTSGSTSSKGGYREPPRMVNVVHRSCAGHHPDYYDPAPVKQNISVYYGDMVYGRVSFAILGDRQFKSGPERVETGSGRADHVFDPDFDTSVLDQPGLVLLGDRQEQFLEHWVQDWRGHDMKVLLSQTVFAGVATHHGKYDGYLKADLDSGGWPQTARDRAIRILRPGMPLHINGDQHLTSLVQYGVDGQRNACWSFCVPAIAAGYPRWWRPDESGMAHENRPKHDLPDTGEYRDGFGNPVYVYAVGNPEVGAKPHRYERAHQKGSGFGFVTIDHQARTYTIESYRFLIDVVDGKASNQFPGWPVVLKQAENRGENELG